MTMEFTNQLRTAANKEDDPHKRKLLSDAAMLLTVYQHVGGSIFRIYNEVCSDLKRMAVPESLVSEIAHLRDAVVAMGHINNCSFQTAPNGRTLIRYEDMDPDDPPKGIKLEVCTNCHRPGRVKEGKNHVTYIHTAWERRRGKVRPRHYCRMSRDGMKLDVVIPVMPTDPAPPAAADDTKEAPCST
jgi:hypothetical protein